MSLINNVFCPGAAKPPSTSHPNSPLRSATFKAEKNAKALAAIATKYGLDAGSMTPFVEGILQRMIFDGEQISDLLAPLNLGWKARTQKELALMEALIPLLHKPAQGREISGLSAYEQ